jgi:phosphonate degradation associated HDIG domain protein
MSETSLTQDKVISEPLTLARIEALFSGHGAEQYGRDAAVSQTEHALQCATLAEAAGESEAVIVAALLHDIGHLMMHEDPTIDLRHQEVGAGGLTASLGTAVTEPVRLHVAAKRYLCSVDQNYWSLLSVGSKNSLEKQGGPFNEEQATAFASQPHAEVAVRVRQYDDRAKIKDAVTPPLAHFMAMVESQLQLGPRG